jgi:hypothetical protein
MRHPLARLPLGRASLHLQQLSLETLGLLLVPDPDSGDLLLDPDG